MTIDYYQKSIELHKKLGGKLAIQPKIQIKNKDDLSLVYTPGVAQVCREIADDPHKVYDLTIKQNTVAIVSDGSAVLGLGNIGAAASIPVMEGKAILFKEYAGIDAFPICVNTQNAFEIIVCDSHGIISRTRTDIQNNITKMKLAGITNRQNKEGSLAEAMVDADVFIGVSVGNVVTQEMVRNMHRDPVILAMANPTPEIMPEAAKAAGAFIVGTGRSDFPNQVNNVLAFPGIFRGALDAHARQISNKMKIAAAYALAAYVENPTPDEILPTPLEKNVAACVAKAVREATVNTQRVE